LVLTTGGENIDATALSGKRVAVPSERSTAYLLFRLWATRNVPGGVCEIVVMPFHEIMPAVRDGLIDAGLVIHEARFTYQNYGLSQVVDLGSWWESDTGLPIPLGAIIARRTLDLPAITKWIQASVAYAWEHPDASREYVLAHSQEMEPSVAQSHIDLYVNEFTASLGEDGFAAVTSLLQRAMDEDLVPRMDLEALLG
jgi:1,4-dihydroxy-6-naphthoate synthase